MQQEWPFYHVYSSFPICCFQFLSNIEARICLICTILIDLCTHFPKKTYTGISSLLFTVNTILNLYYSHSNHHINTDRAFRKNYKHPDKMYRVFPLNDLV